MNRGFRRLHGSQVTIDAGLLAYRELHEALGLTVMAADVLTDRRTGSNTQHSMMALLRQSVDPSMRHVVGGRAKERNAASTRRTAALGPSERAVQTV